MNETIKDESLVEEFLTDIEQYKIKIDELRLEILKCIENQKKDIDDFQPVIMMDFDNRIFYLQYPEPNNFEDEVFENWHIEEECDFVNIINQEDKFWIYKAKNLFEV